MKEKPEPPEEPGCPLWMVTFGDAVSLLVTFFVMLVSFADFEEHALQNMLGALKGGLRAVPMPMATTVASMESEDEDVEEDKPQATDDASAVALKTQMEANNDLSQDIVRTTSPDYYLNLLENGVSLVVKCSAVFDRGTDQIVQPDHDAWQLARDLANSVHNELRISVTLPENMVVRMDDCTTSWGLGIEQTLAVLKLLTAEDPKLGQKVSSSVRIMDHMRSGDTAEGTVELFFVGATEVKMKGMPRRILRGTWGIADEEPSDG